MHERKDGLREGVARGLSQACVYCLEAQKTLLQVYGKIPVMEPAKLLHMTTKGMLESVLTSGIVFGTYFSVYNGIGMTNPLAGPLATFTTSVIKIPISNSMRLLQAGMAPSLIGATSKILKAQRMRGLYSGYGVSILEDLIEMDMRIRLYNEMKKRVPDGSNPAVGVGLGAISGMLASWVTTPFDTIRAHMAIAASTHKKNQSAWRTTCRLYRKTGIKGMYCGSHMRALSNGMKCALFFMFFEMLQTFP
jgi:hypothetical protein